MNKQNSKKVFLTIIALVGIFSLVTQLCLSIHNTLVPLAETIIRYFGFFTIEGNILVTVAVIFLLASSKSKWGRFFSDEAVLSAITVYIVIVGLVYNIVLRPLYVQHGMQAFVDNLLHVAVPILFLFYWIVFVPKAQLKWNISRWLIYPTVYALVVMARGAFVNYYPYFFLNAGKFGYPRVLLNIAGLIVVFVVISLLLVATGKLASRTFTRH